MPVAKNPDQRSLHLIAAAAHDIKTPLVFIRGAASELAGGEASAEDLARQLNRIEQSAGRLLNLVDALIGSAQASQQELILEPLQTDQVIYQTLEDIGPYADQLGFTFSVKTSRHLPLVLSHQQGLKRVLFNLLDNAIKYSQGPKDIIVRARRDGDKVRLSVRDYGVGIRPEDLSQIWKLFGRAAEPAPSAPASSGLGLYIASNLSRSLAAELEVQPLRRGSNFFLRLPIAHQLSLF